MVQKLETEEREKREIVQEQEERCKGKMLTIPD